MLKEIQRKFTHFIGLVIPILYHYIDGKLLVVGILALITCSLLCFELLRYVFPDFGSLFLRFVSPILRSHEKQGKLLGSTYFMVGSLFSIILFPQEIAIALLNFLLLLFS